MAGSFGADVEVVDLAIHRDDRGQLTAIDMDALPFPVRRVFVVADVPAGTRRGGHSHARGVQALVCLTGRIVVELRRAGDTEEVTLHPDGRALRIAAGVWSQQLYVTPGSALLVLSSEKYDPASYRTVPD